MVALLATPLRAEMSGHGTSHMSVKQHEKQEQQVRDAYNQYTSTFSYSTERQWLYAQPLQMMELVLISMPEVLNVAQDASPPPVFHQNAPTSNNSGSILAADQS